MGAVLEYLAGAPAIVMLLKITLLLTAAWAMHAALARANPRWRVWMWRTTLVGLALPAVWTCGLPGWNWNIATMRAVIVDENGASHVAADPQPVQPEGISLPHAVPISPMRGSPQTSNKFVPGTRFAAGELATRPLHRSWSVWLPVTWLAVALLLLGRLIAHVWSVARMIGRSTQAADRVERSLAILAAESGIKGRVAVRESVEVASPLLTGLLRPVIVLPQGLARESDPAAIRMILGHELAHVAGRDLWWTLCLSCASIALWFHPLMWRVSRAHRLACEMVADGLAAGPGGRGDYAQLLAKLALLAHRRLAWEAGIAMLTTAEITLRLIQLDSAINVRRLSRRHLYAAVAGLEAMIVGLAGLSISAADTSTSGSESAPAVADGENAEPPDDDIATAGNQTVAAQPTVPTLTATVHVTDQQGRPVAGAVVKPFGLRSRREPGSHYGWNEKTFGPPPSVTTDADGIARVPCPKYVYEEVETGTVTWLVDHPDHVVFWADRPVTDDPAEIPLEEGVVIAVRAIDDTTDHLVKAPFAMLSGPSFGKEWTLRDDGTLVSRTVARERRILRVVHVPDDEHDPVLFSDVIDLQRQPGDVLDLTLRLKPGVHVTGKIDDVVPRPVAGGSVSAMVIAGPQDNGQEATYDARWSWNEVAAIDEQGRFDLGWFPQGELLQVIAVCDGFVSAPPDQQQLALSAARLRPPFVALAQDRRTRPQVASLEGRAIDVAMPMAPTTSCRIRMVGPDGAPVSGATVAFWPNQIWLSGGSQVLGDGFSQSGWIRASRREDAGGGSLARNQIRHDASPRYQATSGDDGIAVVTNLPLENQASFHVTHPELELPPGQFLRRDAAVDLVAGQVAEFTVTLQPKGTQVLGRED